MKPKGETLGTWPIESLPRDETFLSDSTGHVIGFHPWVSPSLGYPWTGKGRTVVREDGVTVRRSWQEETTSRKWITLAFHALVTLGMPGLMRFLTCTSHGVVHCTSKNQINQEQLQEKCRREVGVMLISVRTQLPDDMTPARSNKYNLGKVASVII